MGCCESDMAQPDSARKHVTIDDLKPTISKNKQSMNSEQDWRKIELPLKITLDRFHDHALEYIENIKEAQEGDGEWCCNGVEIFKDGCKSGQKELGLHEGIKCYRSTDADADFDLCEQCIRWIQHNENIQGDMGVGNL